MAAEVATHIATTLFAMFLVYGGIRRTFNRSYVDEFEIDWRHDWAYVSSIGGIMLAGIGTLILIIAMPESWVVKKFAADNWVHPLIVLVPLLITATAAGILDVKASMKKSRIPESTKKLMVDTAQG